MQKDFEEFNNGGTIPCDMKDYLINQEPNKFLYLKTTDKSDEFYFAQFNYFLNKYKSKLDPYCRFIFNIFKYVDEEDKKSAKRYLKILWAQMSEEELIVLFYYAKNKELLGDTKFLSWLKKYDFLDDLNDGVFLKYDHKEKFCCNN